MRLGGLARTIAQDSPINIGTQFLAAHHSMSGTLDLRAAFRRNRAFAAGPLIDGRRLDRQDFRQPRDATYLGASALDWGCG